MLSGIPDMVRKLLPHVLWLFYQPDSAASARQKQNHHGVDAKRKKNDVAGRSRRITKSTGDHVLPKSLIRCTMHSALKKPNQFFSSIQVETARYKAV